MDAEFFRNLGGLGELALAGVAVALAVAAAAFFGLRGLRPRDPVKREEEAATAGEREPQFGDDASSPANGGGSAGAGGTVPAAGAGGAAAEKGAGSGRGAQGELEMISFVPPKLPEPSEELIPLDICHAARLHCRAENAAEWLRGSDLAPLRAGLRECGMPVFRFLACDAAGEWRIVKDEEGGAGGGAAAGERFRHWLVAFPLADRGGAITEEKIRAVERETRRFAELRRLHPAFPPMKASLDNAKLVDEFCGRVDIEIILHAGGSARPSRGSVEKMLRLQGLEEDEAGGRLVWRKDGEVRYGAAARKAAGAPGDVSGVEFRLDVPNVSDPGRALDEMLECARAAARVFFFQVRDPEGGEITEERAKELRALAVGVAEDMRQHGVAPGGDVARLLFS